jgi:hypothetical protein
LPQEDAVKWVGLSCCWDGVVLPRHNSMNMQYCWCQWMGLLEGACLTLPRANAALMPHQAWLVS